MIADTAELFNHPRPELRNNAGVLGPGRRAAAGNLTGRTGLFTPESDRCV
jgi:hypothetical protein